MGSTTHNELNRPRDAGNENGTLRQGSGCVFFSCRPDLTRGSRPPACPPARPPARSPVRCAQRAPACRSVPARLNAFQRAPACSSALPPAPARPPARPPFPPPAVRGASHALAMAVALPVLSRRVVSCSVAQVVCSLFSSRIVSSPAWSGDAQRFALAFGFFCWVSSGAPHVPVLALGALCSQRPNKKQNLSKAVCGRSVVSAGLLAPHRLARSDNYGCF